MKEKTNKYTISIYTENHIGLLSRITLIFTRRHINIESLTVSQSEIEGVHRFTIVVNVDSVQVHKIVTQLEKQVEVIKAFYHTDEETVFQEIALYKISTSTMDKNRSIENIVRDNNASIVSVNIEFLVIEKTGHEREIDRLLELLRPFGIKQFVRSGRVVVTRDEMRVSSILK